MLPEKNDEYYESLAEKWLTGTISEAEKKAYADWYLKTQDQPLELSADFAGSGSLLRDRIYKNLSAKLGLVASPQPVRSAGLRMLRRTAAAAILLAVLGVAYFAFRDFGEQQSNNTSSLAANDVAPGSDQAVLTLANGKQIVLNEYEKGNADEELAALGVARLGKGILQYKAGSGPIAAGSHLLTTPRGGQFRIELPDGSAVWLNAASSIRFPTSFSESERRVTVTGEAYFEVAKDAGKPFIVQAVSSEIKVLGTHFNINAYPEENGMLTTLLEGSVEVRKSGKAQLLQPGEQAFIMRASPEISLKTNVDTEEVVAWKNGLFQFRGADLPTFMRQLERWYNIEVAFEGEPKGYALEGKLERNLNLSQVLQVLDQMGIKYELNNRKLTVKP